MNKVGAKVVTGRFAMHRGGPAVWDNVKGTASAVPKETLAHSAFHAHFGAPGVSRQTPAGQGSCYAGKEQLLFCL
jgi:hypothetical protein